MASPSLVDDMRCSKCDAEGETSRVDINTAVGGFNPIVLTKDDEGRLHFHDKTLVTTHYSCSRLHNWTVTEATPCPVEGCAWSADGD